MLDPTDPMTRLFLGDLRGIDGDLSGAAEEHDRALALAPNNADVLSMLGSSRALVCGNPAEACALAERALRLNPQAPSWYYAQLARARFVAGRCEECLSALRQSPPDDPVTLMFRALCHASLGKVAQTQTIAKKIGVEFPTFTVENFIRKYPVTNPLALRGNQGRRSSVWFVLDAKTLIKYVTLSLVPKLYGLQNFSGDLRDTV